MLIILFAGVTVNGQKVNNYNNNPKLIKVSSEVIVNKAAAEVWKTLYSDYGNVALFHPSIASSSFTNGDKKGYKGAQRQCNIGEKKYIKESIIEVENGERFVVKLDEAEGVPFDQAYAVYELSLITENQTKVTQTSYFRTKPAMIGKMMKRKMDEDLAGVIIGLKFFMESEQTVNADNFKSIRQVYNEMEKTANFTDQEEFTKFKNNNISLKPEPNTTITNSVEDKIYMTVLIYLNDGMEAVFDEYKQKSHVIAKKYGANIERIIKPVKLAKGNMELPYEIHIASFSSAENAKQMKQDADYLKLVRTLRDKAVKSLVFMPCKLSDFKFEREIGTKDKMFGLALLNYNEGMKPQFDEYHNEACEILPEFGAHFERFFDVEGVKGDFKKPDEIHLFYFDSPEGMKLMGQDERMQALFPKRDAALSDLNFIIGKSI